MLGVLLALRAPGLRCPRAGSALPLGRGGWGGGGGCRSCLSRVSPSPFAQERRTPFLAAACEVPCLGPSGSGLRSPTFPPTCATAPPPAGLGALPLQPRPPLRVRGRLEAQGLGGRAARAARRTSVSKWRSGKKAMRRSRRSLQGKSCRSAAAFSHPEGSLQKEGGLKGRIICWSNSHLFPAVILGCLLVGGHARQEVGRAIHWAAGKSAAK